ncbi:MAG: sigma-54 dependent transcriptional regulator [Betaproteobacteria bacterium]|jgi:two-component system response regulator FlrC|nr:sigma-54 dependent transcriptional regulator [Betaproteobacteria bacterium]
MSHPPVMIVEDDADLREAICVTLDLHQITYQAFEDAESALMAFGAQEYSLVVSDFRLPGMDGLTLLRSIRKKVPQLPVVIMTAFAEAKLAVEALQTGARDFLIKPFQPEHLVGVIARYQPAIDTVSNGGGQPIVARAPATLSVLSRCQRVATTNATVLLTGESGVGKDVFARQIHSRSPRSAKPYIAINCAAIPETLLESTLFGFERGAFTGAVKPQEGKFETANSGTLFLDEIGELPIELQAKLLRVIQDRVVERIGSTKSQEVDVRIIAATNRDLLERVSAGKFREDLYYRLAVFPIAIPPLRERMEDVIPMAELFLERYGTTMGRPGLALSEDAKAAINAHRWPGNVRELENAVQRALLLCDGEAVMPEHLELRAVVARVTAGGGLAVNGSRGAAAELPAWGMEPPQAGVDFASTGEDQPADLETVEREHILRVLKTTGGNRKKAIDILGISERALRYKLKDYKEKGFYSGKD